MVYVRRYGSRRFKLSHKNRRSAPRIRRRQRFGILNMFLNPSEFIAYLIFFIIFIGIFIAALISVIVNPIENPGIKGGEGGEGDTFKNKDMHPTKLKTFIDRLFNKTKKPFKTKSNINTHKKTSSNEHTLNIVVKTDNNNHVDNNNNTNTNTNNTNTILSHLQYQNLKAHERVINPLLPPERSMDDSYGIPINIPTRGESGSFQQIGALYKEVIQDDDMQVGNNTDSIVLALYGKPTYPRSNKWTYYTSSDSNHQVKMPLFHKGHKCDSQHGCEEIMNNDLITIPSYNGSFKAVIYDYDSPKYIPCV